MTCRLRVGCGCAVLLLAMGGVSRSNAQAVAESKVAALEDIKDQADLDRTIRALDTQLFDAYNHCELKEFDRLLADDVEFYHDQGGVTLGHAALTESVRNNICTGDTQRVLVPGTQLQPPPLAGAFKQVKVMVECLVSEEKCGAPARSTPPFTI